MSWLPWVLLAIAVVVAGYLVFSARDSFAGQGKFDARGNPMQNQAPPANVDPASALYAAIGGVVGAGLQYAGSYAKK